METCPYSLICGNCSEELREPWQLVPITIVPAIVSKYWTLQQSLYDVLRGCHVLERHMEFPVMH
jgi:hypothetical protein